MRAAALLALLLAPAPGPAAADEPLPAAEWVAELRRSFSIDGKPIPPEVFRDFGDGDLSDNGPIWVTVDLAAATGSNLYFDKITRRGDWVEQRKVQADHAVGDELTGYRYIGATENGLLVVVASYSGGGSGVFMTLHILDAATGRGFDALGKAYERLNLTDVQNIPLGDRWLGDVSIARNTVTIVTERAAPNDDSGVRRTMTIEAQRP